MPFVSGADIVADVLFRAGENAGSSEWDAKVIDYVNRAYGALCAGSSEFLPETVEDWWWMRNQEALILDPVINAGTADVTNGSDTVTFSIDPGAVGGSLWRLKITGHPDIFWVSSIVAGVATLDSVYTGDTDATANYELYHVQYNLAASVSVILSPIASFRDNPQLFGTSPERMDFLYPVMRLTSGIPQAFCLETETRIRFSHGGRIDGKSMRVEYRFRPTVMDIENTSSSIPLIPVHYRHVLSDMALSSVHADKNDDRMASVAGQARATLMAMVKENHRRLTKVDMHSGHVFPRSGSTSRKILRTETGLIIG